MPNISSQLYNYVSKLVIEYFDSQKIQAGDRFNLYLEEERHIVNLYNALKKNNSKEITEFKYKHPEGGGEYISYRIKIGEIYLIVASSQNASEDYFTMLRNKVADQKDGFENTAILILFSGKLDSLLGGSGSLIKEGMPLHYSSFKKQIQHDIENVQTLKKYEKDILVSVLDRKTKSVIEDNNSIFDYEQVINVIEKGNINLDDYAQLGMFPHEELKTKGTDIAKDLSGNFTLYEEFENIFLNGSPEIDLRERLSDSALTKIIKEDWKKVDYAQLTKWIDAEKSKQPPRIIEVKTESSDVKIWMKDDGNSVSKKRNVNVVLFNPNFEQSIKINVKFDQFIKKEGINVVQGVNELTAINSGHSISIEVKEFNSSEIFGQIEYKDPETEKKYIIRILHLPFTESVISQFETCFQIKTGKAKSFVINKEFQTLIFNEDGEHKEEVSFEADSHLILGIDQELKLKFDSSNNQEELINFTVQINKTDIPFQIKQSIDRPIPISGLDVWKEKRVHGSDFKFLKEEDIIKLVFKNTERTVSGEFRNNLIQERQIIDSHDYSWFVDNDNNLNSNEIELEEKIKVAFDSIRTFFKSKDLQPSLVHYDNELKQIASNYIRVITDELESFPVNQPLTRKQKNLLWLGVVKENFGERRIKFSPLHPINVAYQLFLNDTLKNEDIYNAVLKRLNPTNLIPYLENKKEEIYIPVETYHSPEWLYYSVYLNSKQSIPKSFVSNLVTNKLKDFTTNFNFLFVNSQSAPIKINVINLGDCKEVVQGIFEFYRKDLNAHPNKRPNQLLPIEINIYGSEKLVTKFEELTFYEKVEDVERELEIKLLTSNFDKEDLLNIFLDKVNFYTKKVPSENEEYEYSHITFYQFDRTKTKSSTNKMNDVKTGLSMNGLMADVSSIPSVDTYRTGFGSKYLPENKSSLTNLSCLYNSFVRVASNDDNYEKNKVICTTINYDIKEQLSKLYTKSQWVTYIDPKVELDFFKENSDLVIVHYSDQYTNSSGYDAITVSRKTDQYKFVVKEFLEKHNVTFDPSIDTIQVINFFNAINGEWLLKLIRQDSQFPREKLSLLSGIKTALAFLYSPSIIWIPVSLEEILRVSGNAGLAMDEGLFSTKNLGGIGSFSDDLLFIGLENCENQLLMHLYPVELKIGGLGIVKKGKEQGQKTADLLKEHLNKEGFLGEFYKNFFAKIALTNAEKMSLFHVWDNQKWNIVFEDYREDLLNNDFKISYNLNKAIGDFGLVYFGNDTIKRTLNTSEGLMKIDLLEIDGYDFLVKSVDESIDLFHNSITTIETSKLLINNLPSCSDTQSLVQNNQVVIIDENVTIEEKVEEIISIENEKTQSNTNNHLGIEVLFGTNLNNSKPVIWEPNNTNKVMHTNTGIIGTMGTGKTQFTKSLITQLYNKSADNIGDEKLGILIFDYKGDYIKDDFVSATNAKVLNPHNLPYNPLALDADEKSKPMLPLHTANDIKETISNAFNLGTVQKQKLRDIIVEAYESKGIRKADESTWTLTAPTLGDVCDLYLSDPSVSQDSLYAAISNLSEFEIFESNPSRTKSLYSLIEGIVVINLSGYDESIQNLIVAITLDAFYSQMQRHGHSKIDGSMREIKKMILVDEADNFLSKNFNSIRKILKEGREFGVGTILSTQFLNHFATSENEYSNYILTWVIHRVNEIKTREVESLFSLDSKLQKENLIKTIKGLDKHQSIVNLAGSEPILIQDKAFWELLKDN